MIDFFNATKEAFPALLAIFVTVFCLILVTRLIFAILIHFARKKYEAIKKIKINLLVENNSDILIDSVNIHFFEQKKNILQNKTKKYSKYRI